VDEFMAGALLREVARLHDRLQRESVACCGTTSTQCQIITTLGRNGPMTLAELGRTLGLDKGWVSRAVESLAEEKLVLKEPGDADRRTIIVALSEEGETRLAALDATLNGLSERVMQRIPAGQRANVYAALEVLRDALLAEPRPGIETLSALTGG
jgi:DNA-binding MarR family transcriptional regulator